MSISVCSVLLSGMDDYVRVFLDTLNRNCQLVDEVIFTQIDSSESSTFTYGRMKVRKVGIDLHSSLPSLDQNFCFTVCGHAFGLHAGIDLAKNDLIWLCDPDVFLLAPVDAIFADLMAKHDLRIVGVSHFNIPQQSYNSFPCITSCMVRKSQLPGKEWMAGRLHVQSGMRVAENGHNMVPVDGHFLIPGPVRQDEFPNPGGIFDAGCDLWLWNKDTDGRWVSFWLDVNMKSFRRNFGSKGVVYPMNYRLQNFDSNFGLSTVGVGDILYHRTRGARESSGEYLALYESLFGRLGV